MRTNDLKRVLWLLLLSVGLAAVGRAQSYIRLTDATGLPPDARELDSLKEASRILEELVTLYAPGGGSFKVFDVGLYSHGQYFSGGYEELFETARRQAASQSEQYLLFGRQVVGVGVHTKLWIDLRLDAAGQSCLEAENLAGVLQSLAGERLKEGQASYYVYRLEAFLIKELTARLEEAYCCSGYYPEANMTGAVEKRLTATCIDEAKIDLAAAALIDRPAYASFLEKLIRIKIFYDQCQSQEWRSLGPDGIIPMCIWEDLAVSPPYYTVADVPFYAGVTDGLYAEARGAADFLLSLDDIGRSLVNLYYSYTIYYLVCEQEASLNKLEFNALMEDLYGAQWSDTGCKAIFDQAYDLFSGGRRYAELIFSKLTGEDCAHLEKTRNTVDKLYEAVVNLETWVEVYRTLITEAGRLWENINGFSNFERYYHGYYGIKAAMLFLPPLGKGTYLGNLPGYLDDVMRKIRGGGKFYYTRSLDESLSRELLKKIRGDPPYANWEEAVRQQFDGDFLGDYNSMKRLEEGGLFGAWERLIDAPGAIRSNIKLLEDVTNWPASWNMKRVGNSIEVIQSSTGRKLATVFEGKITAPGRAIIGETGNPLLNRVPLVRGMSYEVDGILYETDGLGRVFKTSGDLDDMVRVRLGNQQIRAVDVKDGVRGTDQGGHIIGARFFGAGEQINYYPQSANLNQGAWKRMEDRWAAAMVEGKDVKVEIQAIYDSDSFRPDRFRVVEKIDGEEQILNFANG